MIGIPSYSLGLSGPGPKACGVLEVDGRPEAEARAAALARSNEAIVTSDSKLLSICYCLNVPIYIAFIFDSIACLAN